MNVILVSQCNKNALVETRRILDQFAERRGSRTWQTPITQEGLDTLHRMLRKTARKNTAVACHWIRRRDHSELLWIVGDASRFNNQGAIPTETTRHDIRRADDENDWHSAEEIRLLAALAALLHDLGKANAAFQRKLTEARHGPEPYRHEWVSLRLFEAFVAKDTDAEWLNRLSDLDDNESPWLNGLVRDGIDTHANRPFKSLPPVAQAVGWLILTHHRLPVPPAAQHNDLKDLTQHAKVKKLNQLPETIEATWCGARTGVEGVADCWRFPKGLPVRSAHWRRRIHKVARRLLARSDLLQWQDRRGQAILDEAYIIHLARLALMLADHHYSSQPSHAAYGDPNLEEPVFANTDRSTHQPKQLLDEHLIGVEVNAGAIIRSLPRLERELPRIARHKRFRQRATNKRFRWQDKAFDRASGLRQRSIEHGFFGVNMASTGAGKTIANGRILYALAHPQRGARFSIALGLRTLTLQTGEFYRKRMGLGAEDLAVLVGGPAVRELFEHGQEHEPPEAQTGSESAAELLTDSSYVHFEGSLDDGPLNQWLSRPANTQAKRLLNAPVLVCTVDHLIPATEGIRGGHQIAPMLRLMSGDLVLDEPDDFGLEDMHALARLVHWAGLLGSRVLLSSATLPPALVRGLFRAYGEGRQAYQRHRGVPGRPINICCAWFDEFDTAAEDCPLEGAKDGEPKDDLFAAAHSRFVDGRLQKLQTQERRRLATVHPMRPEGATERTTLRTEFARLLHEPIHELHHSHGVPMADSNQRVSFGLVRLAHIDALIDVAQALYNLGAQDDHRIHLCAYHAQHPLLVRSGIEKRLDRLLNRTGSDAVFSDPEIQQRVSQRPELNHIFLILATPVAEVGRDHDYDWAIVEPSSVRSIIQLAGRVRRHRDGGVEVPNVYLLDTNLRHLEHPEQAAFCRPGFECVPGDSPSPRARLKTHRLSELLTSEQLQRIDSGMRIKPRPRVQFSALENLADLEHHQLHEVLLDPSNSSLMLPVNRYWRTRAHLTGLFQRIYPFRPDPIGRVRYGLLPHEDGTIAFCRYRPDGPPVPQGHLYHERDLTASMGPRIELWGEPNYATALEALAERFDESVEACALRFGYVDLPANETDQGWDHYQGLGLRRHR